MPEGWVWCRLSQIIILYSGQDLEPSRYNDNSIGIPYITGASNFEDGRIIINRWTDSPTTHATIDDLLLTCKGSGVGKMVWCNIENAHIARQIMALRCIDGLYKNYLEIVMLAFLSKIVSKANGLIPGLSRDVILNMTFPLPPFNEQTQIYHKSKEILSYTQQVDKETEKLIDIINITKSKILDLAIRGKLVPQNPNDEPASVLLERIRAEKEELIKQGKIKRDKKETIIFRGDDNSYYEKIGNDITCIDDEIPFETPINWQWVRLGSTVGIERGGSPRPIKSYITTDSNGINWIKIGDVDKDGKYITNTKEKIKPTGIKKSREVYPGDFLLTNSMSFGRPYISKIYGCVHDGWLVLRNPDVVFDINFLYYLLSSNYLYNQFVIKASGSTVDNLNIDKVSSALICLPPLKEQTMIVNQIEKLMKLIQQFEELL